MIDQLMSHRYILTISIIVLSIFLLTKCINNQKQEKTVIKNADGDSFAGSEKCSGCHKDIYNSHINTAHYLTSQPAAEQYIKGSFENGKNRFVLNDYVKVVMEKREDSFCQVAYLNGTEKQSSRIDIVIGSGTKGQTYLNWKKDELFQLPISYFTAVHQWANSPGYPGQVVFNRPISSRCLECHTTYAQKISEPNEAFEEFDHNKILYGVDCEKCHGPASKHVEFQLQNPKDTVGRYIINPSVLSRQQNLDLCGLCHGGRLSKIKPSFGFEAGDKLSDYFLFDTVGKRTDNIDVHGNQYGLLAASKCFKMSQMTCSSCHNSHENEKGKIALLSQRCLNCHNNEHGNNCKMGGALGSSINQNCVDCHMPNQVSRSIVVFLQGAEIPTAAMIRTHLIKIYPDETKKILASIKHNITITAQ